MAMPEMEAVKDAALKYDKKTLGRLAQLGQISATLAVMAGMMRDRIVQSEMKPSTKTVSQDVLPADSMGIEGFSDPTAVQQPVMRRAGGLTNIPVRDNMYEMAGGGIVAFQAGGATPSFTSALAGEIPADPRYLRAYQAARGEKMPRKGLTELMTLSELQEFNRTGAIPERLSAQVQGRMIEDIPAFGAGTYEPEVSTPFVGKTPEQIDQFSGTQTLGGAVSQTDPGAVLGDKTPSTAMLKQAAEDEAKRTQERRAAAPAAPKPTGEAKPQGISFNSILSEIQGQMPQGEAYGSLEREVLKDREARKGDKEKALYMFLANTGANMAAGESPYFAVNAGKAVATSLKGYAEDLKDQKKLDREDRKVLADIEQARRAEKVGNFKLASERYEKALDRTSAEKRSMLQLDATLRATAMQVSKPSAQVELIREMIKDPKTKEMVITLAREKAAAKDPFADVLRQALAGGGGSNVGAQLGELMKKYPQAFQ